MGIFYIMSNVSKPKVSIKNKVIRIVDQEIESFDYDDWVATFVNNAYLTIIKRSREKILASLAEIDRDLVNIRYVKEEDWEKEKTIDRDRVNIRYVEEWEKDLRQYILKKIVSGEVVDNHIIKRKITGAFMNCTTVEFKEKVWSEITNHLGRRSNFTNYRVITNHKGNTELSLEDYIFDVNEWRSALRKQLEKKNNEEEEAIW